MAPLDVELDIPLFAHECFSGNPTADNRLSSQYPNADVVDLQERQHWGTVEKLRNKDSGARGLKAQNPPNPKKTRGPSVG